LGHALSVARWQDVEREEPAFAARVRDLFDARKHKTLATLRADGSPRISGIEVEFADGELTFGSMPGARKGADLVRDPRFALHGPTVDPPEGDPSGWPGEAKVAGRAVLVGDLEGETSGQLFHAALDEVVLTRLTDAADRLLVEVWRPGRPLRRVERD
jgi:Pyridoxamine 5'-phosphate oxidase